MWPDAYIDWARGSRQFVRGILLNMLSRRIRDNDRWTEASSRQVAESAVRFTFDVANEHRRYSELFHSEGEFRRWGVVAAIFEAIRLLIQHRLAETLLPQLPAVQRQVLVMAFADHMSVADLAGILQIGNDEVRRLRHESLDAFFRLLDEDPGEFDE